MDSLQVRDDYIAQQDRIIETLIERIEKLNAYVENLEGGYPLATVEEVLDRSPISYFDGE